jgi:hypothetical protein
MTAGSVVPELRQLAGPGVPGMENDPSLYHVDLDRDNLDKLLADPVGFFEHLGVGPEQGIAPHGTMKVVYAVEKTDPASKKKPKVCIFVVADTAIVHPH